MTFRRVGAVLLGWATGLALLALYLGLGQGVDDLVGHRPLGPELYLWLAGSVIVAALAAWAGPAPAGQSQAADEARTRRDLVAHIFALGAAERTRERAGRIVSTATDGVERAAAFRATFVAPMIASMTLPVLVLAVLAWRVDPVAAGWLALGVPAIPIALGGFQAMFRNVSARYRAHARELSAQFLDAIQGLPTLRLLGAGPDMGRKLARSAEALRRHVMRLLAGNQVMLFVVDAAFSLAFLTLAAGLALARLRSGAITPGAALALILASTLLLEPLDRVGQFFYVGMGGIAASKEIKALLAEVPTVADPGAVQPAAKGRKAKPAQAAAAAAGTGAGGDARAGHLACEDVMAGETAPGETVTKVAAKPEPAIEFDQVSFAYDPAVPVLDGVNLRIEPGERVALIGPSGVGKSTVAALLAADRRPDQGQVRLCGRDVTTMPLAWQRGQLSVVAQHTYLFTGTLRSNLLIADPDASDERLWAALDAADLAAFVKSLPEGLDTPAGERGLALSGGQTQRLAIARAWLKDAPILILDEPTAHVDLASERAILGALRRLGQGRTVLTISHRQTTIADAQRTLVLDGGQVHSRGSA